MPTLSLQKLLYVFVSAASTLLLLACASSAPPKPHIDFKSDYDFRTVKTFAFLPRRQEAAASTVMSDMTMQRVDRGLERALIADGLTLVAAESADILLTWHLVAQERTNVRSYDSMSYYNGWRCGPAVSDVSVREYTQGTFIVDMIDPAINQSVWRGVIEDRLKENPDVEGQQARIDAVAMSMLEQFPPL
jgi:hypothetical protein